MTRMQLRTASRVVPTLLTGIALGLGAGSGASAQSLDSFAILSGSTITNTNISTVDGNIGLSPGSATTGTGPAGADHIVLTNGTLHINDGVAQDAKSDLTAAFNILMGRATTTNLTGETLGVGAAATLTAGVYNFDTSAQLNGILTLNGSDTDVFVFKIGTTLTTQSASSIVLGGTVQASNVFFVVGSSATLGTTTAFQGQILALESISLNTAATINCGAAWARNGAVTLDTNTINICTFQLAPGTFGDILAGDTTDNEQAVIDAINAFLDAGGTLPLAFEVLALLTPEELARALSELSGEVGSSAPRAGSQAMDSFLDAVMGGPGSGRTVIASPYPDDNTVSVMGYVPSSPGMIERNSALATVDAATGPGSIDPSAWTIWSAIYGGQGTVVGDAEVGTHGVRTQDFGYAMGFERQVTADHLIGFALSAGGTSFVLDDGLGTGRSDMLQAAVYGTTEFGDAYLTGALAYGVHDVTTDRDVSFGGHYRGEFIGHQVAAAVEAGYDLGWFTPYIGGRVQGYLTPAYSETTVSGSDMFALNYEANTSLSARTEVGVKFNAEQDFEGGRLSFDGSVAWAHTFQTAYTTEASFQALPGSTFTTTGATPAADLLLVSAGLGAALDNGVTMGASAGADLAVNAQSYKGAVRLGYTF